MNKRALKLLLLFGLIFGTVFSLWLFRGRISVETLSTWVQHAGIWAPMTFIAIYALATLFFLPGSLLTIAGGFLFGPIWGTLYNLTGAVLGATVAFWVAKFIGAEWVKAKVGRRLPWLLEGIAHSGWQFVAMVRLIPAIPFNILNYALGLTPISTVPYVLASMFFMLPGCAAYTYLGYLGETVLAQREGLVLKILWAVALLVFAGFLPWGLKKFKAFKKANLDIKNHS